MRGRMKGTPKTSALILQPEIRLRSSSRRNELGGIHAHLLQCMDAINEIEGGAFHQGLEDFATGGTGLEAGNDP